MHDRGYLSDILGLPLLDAIDVATHCARYENEESEPGDRAGKFARARGRTRKKKTDQIRQKSDRALEDSGASPRRLLKGL